MGTIGIAKKGLAAITLVTTIAGSPVSAVLAQAGASGLVRSPVPGSQPSSALDRATGLAEQPFYTVPMPAPPSGNAPQTGRLWNRRWRSQTPMVGRRSSYQGALSRDRPFRRCHSAASHMSDAVAVRAAHGPRPAVSTTVAASRQRT
jgi:hypothetical protein